jgi:hypothetical protein
LPVFTDQRPLLSQAASLSQAESPDDVLAASVARAAARPALVTGFGAGAGAGAGAGGGVLLGTTGAGGNVGPYSGTCVARWVGSWDIVGAAERSCWSLPLLMSSVAVTVMVARARV